MELFSISQTSAFGTSSSSLGVAKRYRHLQFADGRDGLALILEGNKARTQAETVLVSHHPTFGNLAFYVEDGLVGSQPGDTNVGSESVP
jgi:hypothetical protein